MPLEATHSISSVAFDTTGIHEPQIGRRSLVYLKSFFDIHCDFPAILVPRNRRDSVPSSLPTDVCVQIETVGSRFSVEVPFGRPRVRASMANGMPVSIKAGAQNEWFGVGCPQRHCRGPEIIGPQCKKGLFAPTRLMILF
jgi:hypothetical protein